MRTRRHPRLRPTCMTDGVEQQPALVSAMLEPSFYPNSPEGVELRETNTSWVFLADGLHRMWRSGVGSLS